MNHEVLKLWTRPEEGMAPAEQEGLHLERGKGVIGDHTFGRLRHVTIVFEDDWNAAAAAVGRSVDPAGRRANVLVSGGRGTRHLDSTVRIGEVLVEIKGITVPCPIMDQAAQGMQEALKPEGRGGIWGRVVKGGEIRRGDTLSPVERG
jgi:MOSC domain-containing protein YiiM